jgi:hypothetical protein
LQVPPKFTQIRFFGLKICHLATLARIRAPYYDGSADGWGNKKKQKQNSMALKI